ncbi:unnamed protein product [Mytilus coruscus]|uniref:Uncharacterized protein n=1 Tax=Mytilus coruscus TaxID=42192 RepID=A0A6J8E1P4_MYTCO|nr:unnamed protein product [Mytilus coruscus]
MELKTTENSEQQYFKTRIGLICSCLGCVVGTGNIWRFPRIVANNSDEKGGLVFLIVWSLFLLLWSIPMLLIEYGTGRYTKKAIIGSFQQFMGEKGSWCGAWISMVTFFISCYYSVVLGWCFYYVVYCIANELPDNVEDSRQIFRDYAEDFVWGFALVINGMMLQAMVIFYGTENFRKNLFNRFSLDDWKLPRVWGWMIKFVLPVEAIAIIVWWAVDLIDGTTGDGEKWYEFGRETFVMTILQWGSLMLLVILVNCVVYFYRHKEPALDKRPILDDVDTVMTDTKTPEKQGLSSMSESYRSIRL